MGVHNPEKRMRIVRQKVVMTEYRCQYSRCRRWFEAKNPALYCPQSSGRFCRVKAHRESKR